MNTSEPLDCSRATATDCPPNRVRSPATQISIASGVWSMAPVSTLDVPACMAEACFWSAQSIATIAANSVGIIPLLKFEMLQAALLRRRPYRKVFFLQDDI